MTSASNINLATGRASYPSGMVIEPIAQSADELEAVAAVTAAAAPVIGSVPTQLPVDDELDEQTVLESNLPPHTNGASPSFPRPELGLEIPPPISSDDSDDSRPPSPIPYPKSFGFFFSHQLPLVVEKPTDSIITPNWLLEQRASSLRTPIELFFGNASVVFSLLLLRTDLTPEQRDSITEIQADIRGIRQFLKDTSDISLLSSLKADLTKQGLLERVEIGLEQRENGFPRTEMGEIQKSQDELKLFFKGKFRIQDSPAQAPLSARDVQSISLASLEQSEADRAEVSAAAHTQFHREQFNDKMKFRMTVAYIAVIAFAVLGATVNPWFFAAAWVCFEYGNAAINAQTTKTFSRNEVFHWSLLFRVADFILCSLPRKHFTFTAPPVEITTGPTRLPTPPRTPPQRSAPTPAYDDSNDPDGPQPLKTPEQLAAEAAAQQELLNSPAQMPSLSALLAATPDQLAVEEALFNPESSTPPAQSPAVSAPGSDPAAVPQH